MQILTKKDGFMTLMECVTALAILGALASLAIPRFTMQMEKARAGEGIQYLEAVYKAQRSYYAEYRAYTNNLASLEIDVRPSTVFFAPVVATADPIISLPRNNNAYTLTMTAAG